MNSKERVIAALNIKEPDIVPSYEMGISPPNVTKELLGRVPIYGNYRYLYELWSQGKIMDKESIKQLNKHFVEDCYEAYDKLGLDMIRFFAVGMDPTEFWRADIKPPLSIKKVSNREWIVNGKRLLYDNFSFWNWEPSSSIILKGPEYVHEYIKNEGKKMIEEIKNTPLDNIKYLSKLNKGRKFILTDVGSTNGLIISDRFGMTEGLKWFHTHPDIIKDLLKLYTELTIEVGKVAIDYGTDGVQICEDYGYKNGPWISPLQFKEFVLPNLIKMSKSFRRKGAYFILHSDGNVKPLLNMFVEAGFHAYQSIDKIAGMDLNEVKKKIGDKMCLIGNVNPDILSKKISDVEAEVKRCIKSAAVGGGYIISCGGAMTDSRLSNIKALIKYSRKYGKYPIQII